MSRVLTNEQNYYDIADTIRQMKNVNTTYKPRQMASALKDIYSNEVEGVPPLSFEANGNNLLNYRIDGASGGVGDRTGNLFTNVWFQGGINSSTGIMETSSIFVCSDFIPITPLITYSCSRTVSTEYNNLRCYDANKQYVGTGGDNANAGNPLNNGASFGTFMITNESVAYIRFNDKSNDLTTKYMLVEGEYTASTMPDYEPYGYKVPVVVNGKNLFDENSELNTNSTMDLTTGTFPGSTGDNKRTFFFKAKPNTTYTFSCDTIGDRLVICEYNRIINPSDYSTSHKLTPNIKTFSQASGISEYSFTTSSTTKMVGIYYSLNTLPTSIQIEIGNIATGYEPYIEETTNIYLDEPIEENESISLSDTNTNIPTIDGTNVLTINTTVQPSNVYIQAPKDSIEATQIANELEEI